MSTKVIANRIAREQAFYDATAEEEPLARRIIATFSCRNFCDIDVHSLTWGPVWRALDLNNKAVLDYGCGAGDVSFILAAAGAEVHAIDISPAQIEKNRKRASSWARSPIFAAGDAHHTSFPDNSFDYVIGNAILHHLDLDLCYREISRVLKPGGKAVFREPLRSPLVNIVRRITPSARTADESPLSLADIESASRYFRNVTHREHFLFAILAAPLNLASNAAGRIAIELLDRFDGFIFRRLPFTRSFGWMTMIELIK